MEERVKYECKREPLEQCQVCGRDIYPGERVYVVGDKHYIVCGNVGCLMGYFRAVRIEEALFFEEGEHE